MSVMLETRDALAVLVEGLYSPAGEQEAMLFKSSGELAYEFREMVECTALDVTVVMKKLGYKFQKFDGVVNWVLYELR